MHKRGPFVPQVSKSLSWSGKINKARGNEFIGRGIPLPAGSSAAGGSPQTRVSLSEPGYRMEKEMGKGERYVGGITHN